MAAYMKFRVSTELNDEKLDSLRQALIAMTSRKCAFRYYIGFTYFLVIRS